ncbi:MAG: ABC transporter substrate-binding protein [Thermoplasmatales archaeon]
MNNRLKIIIAVIVAFAVIIGGVVVYYENLPGKAKGEIITLDTGYHLTNKFTRIISLDPAATATLYALGAYSYLVGGNSYDTYPPDENIPNVTDYPSMNLEQIFNLSPDAVISFDNYSGSQISQLLNDGINYVFLSAGAGVNFSIIERQNTLLGELTGTEANATLINQWMNTSLSILHSDATEYDKSLYNGTQLRGFYYLSSEGGYWTAGNDTFINSYFEYADVVNIAAPYDNGFYAINPENIENNSPQVIILDEYINASSLNSSGSPFQFSPAVINSKIYTTTFNENMFSEPNFRDIFAIQWMIDMVYGQNPVLPAFPINLTYNPNPNEVS